MSDGTGQMRRRIVEAAAQVGGLGANGEKVHGMFSVVNTDVRFGPELPREGDTVIVEGRACEVGKVTEHRDLDGNLIRYEATIAPRVEPWTVIE